MPYVDATYVMLLHEHLRSRGIAPEPLIGAPAPEGARVPAAQWQAMLEKGAAATGETAFGLRVAQHVALRHLGVVGYLVLSCSTAMEALQRGQRYHVLVSEMNPMQVRVQGEELQLSWPLQHGGSGQLWDELGLATVVRLIQVLTGTRAAATRVDFVAPAPADLDVYREFFGGEVRFGQPMPALCFPSRYLSLLLPRADAGLFTLLDAQAEQKLQQLAPLSAELQRLRQQLLQLIREGRTRIEHLAAQNRIGVRALQRRLAAQNSSFQALLDDTRRHLAEQYLADPGLELQEVTGLLGYTEQSSFTRAFSKWTGCSPGEWRAKRCR